MNIFQIDQSDLKRLTKFLRSSPQYLPRMTASVLNDIAFESRNEAIKTMQEKLTIRNQGFLKSSLVFQKTPMGNIESQVAYMGSINKERFHGWREEEYGLQPERTNTPTLAARGGNIKSHVKQKARLKSTNKFYKPQQFQGKTLKAQFQFMMRVLNSRGGSNYFLLNQNIPTRKGSLNRGLYLLNSHRITRLQSFGTAKRIERTPWMSLTLTKIHSRRYIQRLWCNQIDKLVRKGIIYK